ncbi:MAG: cytochrome b N-terminal domain-containing protein [Planctomycetota bacterium]|jgi:quinol-cytochrome oxidoreductase complex cytochrome b subunit
MKPLVGNRVKLRRARAATLGTRSRAAAFLRSIAVYHVTPAYRGWRWLSSAVILLFLILVVTGTLLSLYYHPDPDGAFQSARFLTGKITAGWLVRSIHHWSGELFLVALVAHLCLTYFRRSYGRPREYVWMTGVLLLVVALEFRFTGRLLPWDTIGYGATERGLGLLERIPIIGHLWATWLRGGVERLGVNSLSRFYTTHVLVLPWVTVLLGGAHLYLIGRHGLKGDREQ